MKATTAVYRPMIGVVIATAGLLALPLLAMQLTDQVAWTAFDFAFAGVLLLGTGSAWVLATRTAGQAAFRWAVGLGLAAALLLVWVNGAVGLIGSEDNPANVMYGGVLGVALLGVAVARLRPRGMAWAMFAAAGAQAVVAAVALIFGLGAPVTDWVELVGGNGVFVLLWAASGVLFLAASKDAPGAPGAPES